MNTKTRYDSTMSAIEEFRKRHTKKDVEFEIRASELLQIISALEVISGELTVLSEAKEVISKAADKILTETSEGLQQSATFAMKAVYGSEYSGIHFINDVTNPKSPKTQIKFSKHFETEVYMADVYESEGGGFNDVVGFILQFASLISYPEGYTDGSLLIDEFAKHLSEDLIGNMIEMFKAIQKQMQRQIIYITHDDLVKTAFDHVITM